MPDPVFVFFLFRPLLPCRPTTALTGSRATLASPRATLARPPLSPCRSTRVGSLMVPLVLLRPSQADARCLRPSSASVKPTCTPVVLLHLGQALCARPPSPLGYPSPPRPPSPEVTTRLGLHRLGRPPPSSTVPLCTAVSGPHPPHSAIKDDSLHAVGLTTEGGSLHAANPLQPGAASSSCSLTVGSLNTAGPLQPGSLHAAGISVRLVRMNCFLRLSVSNL
jgi:hypothetical protein